MYALVALRRIEGRAAGFSPDITVTVALALLIGACVLFLALLQRVTDRLRPRTLFAAVVREGIRPRARRTRADWATTRRPTAPGRATIRSGWCSARAPGS